MQLQIYYVFKAKKKQKQKKHLRAKRNNKPRIKYEAAFLNEYLKRRAVITVLYILISCINKSEVLSSYWAVLLLSLLHGEFFMPFHY